MKNQRGASMIEILVAVLVLTTSVIGMLGLQSQALKTTKHSVQQTQATFIATTVLDSITAQGNYTDDELVLWNTEAAEVIPGSKVVVENGYITVMWDRDRLGAKGTGCDPDDQDDMWCVSVRDGS
jgi:type IV pilus modification protein PilV